LARNGTRLLSYGAREFTGQTMKRIGLALTVMLPALAPPTALRAEDAKIRILKLEIAQIRHIEKKFAAGLKYCGNLDGNHVFLENQQRILNLEVARASLDNLVKDNVYNPLKKRPWTSADAAERMQQMKRLADQEQSDCARVAKLPALQKELADLEAKTKSN
jgi:hypothetical protein